jgi:hypothetical protein
MMRNLKAFKRKMMMRIVEYGAIRREELEVSGVS